MMARAIKNEDPPPAAVKLKVPRLLTALPI
jgi:hypothetical protein